MAIEKASPEEVAKVTEEMNSFKEMYKNPILVILITYIEILPLGIVYTLISALILKKKMLLLNFAFPNTRIGTFTF